jgi:hypothetical protein
LDTSFIYFTSTSTIMPYTIHCIHTTSLFQTYYTNQHISRYTLSNVLPVLNGSCDMIFKRITNSQHILWHTFIFCENLIVIPYYLLYLTHIAIYIYEKRYIL